MDFYFRRAVGEDGQIWIACIPNRRETERMEAAEAASHLKVPRGSIAIEDSDDDWGDGACAKTEVKEEDDDGDVAPDPIGTHAAQALHAFAESRLKEDPEMEDMAASAAVVVDDLTTGFMEQNMKMEQLREEVRAAAETNKAMHALQRQVHELQESAAKRQREMEYDVEGAAMLEAMERRQAEQRAVPPPPQMWQPQPQMCAAPPPQPWQPQRQQPQRQPLRPGLYSGSSLSGSLCGRVSIGSTARPARPSAPPPPPSTPPPPSILMELGMKQWRGY